MRYCLYAFFLLLAMNLFAQDPFVAKTTFNACNELPLTVHPSTHLQIFQATLNGVPCTMLFDTGASHTTFDRGFIEKHFPSLTLHPIQVNAESNVQQSPSVFRVTSFKLGQANLKDFYAMTLPLGHLGIKVDGILGMNTMAYAPFILDIGNQSVTWLPKETPFPEDAIVLPTLLIDHKTLRLKATIGEVKMPILLDSGSSYTFFPKGLWREDETASAVAFQTSDVNAVAQQSFTRGVKGDIQIGAYTWTLTPFLSAEPGLQLGADELKKVKLFIDAEKKQIGVVP